MTPVLRVASVAAAAMSLLLAGGGLAYFLSHRAPALSVGESQTASVPSSRASLPGDRLLPDSAQAYDQFERQNREAAIQKAGPAAATPPLDTLQPAQTLTVNPRPEDLAEWQRQQRQQDQHAKEREKERQEWVKKRADSMGKVLAVWGGVHKTVEANLKPPEPPRTAENLALYNPLADLPVDRVYYGLLQVFISSDEPGPVVVTLKDGELNGARLIGSFKRAEEKVTILFDRMTFKGAWYTVDAVAINPENGRLGLATAVDRRTFSRWAALLGSAVLQGAQRAYLNQGTQSSYLWGETTTRDYSDREILGIALGEIGTRTRQTATRYFDRPPTVYVDPALQLVGVLFLGPPSQKTQGEASLVAALDPQNLQNGARNQEFLRAAREAMDRNTPPGAARNAGDPSQETGNYTRRSWRSRDEPRDPSD